MTPKEKAIELWSKYKDAQFSGCAICSDNFDEKNVTIKQCALIAADETIASLNEIKNKLSNLGMCSYCDNSAFDEIISFNVKVKEEINQLTN